MSPEDLSRLDQESSELVDHHIMMLSRFRRNLVGLDSDRTRRSY